MGVMREGLLEEAAPRGQLEEVRKAFTSQGILPEKRGVLVNLAQHPAVWGFLTHFHFPTVDGGGSARKSGPGERPEPLAPKPGLSLQCSFQRHCSDEATLAAKGGERVGRLLGRREALGEPPDLGGNSRPPRCQGTPGRS